MVQIFIRDQLAIIRRDIDDEHGRLLAPLWHRLEAVAERNRQRDLYYDADNAARKLMETFPPQYRTLHMVLGWPAKAVDTLSNRCRLDGFTAPFDLKNEGWHDIWEANLGDIESSQVGISSLIHGVAFIVVTKGEAHEPPAIISMKDARNATGIINQRTRRLDSFLSVIERDDDNQPSNMVIFTDTSKIMIWREGDHWRSSEMLHDLGEVPAYPLIHRPRLSRPFGASRITRPVMSLSDMAVRVVLRSELAGEMYSVPQRVVLGADESAFKNNDGSPKDAWKIVMGRIWGLNAEDGGALPKIEQLAAASQEPHMDQLRALAQLFSGATSIPVTELGIHSDANPASAEAVLAHQGSLIAAAEDTIDVWRPTWRRVASMALRVANGYTGNTPPPEAYLEIIPRFRNPANISRAAATDSAIKLISALPWMANSDTTLELLGLPEDVVLRLKNDKRQAEARSTVASLTATGVDPAASELDSAAAIKAKADAMSVLIRAGVAPEDAALQVGLDVEFTGAVPTSLRLPERDADKLEP